MRRDEGGHREGHHAHARDRGRRRRGLRARRGRVGLIHRAADPIPFAGGTLDRAADRRADEAWLAAARGDPAARAIVVGPASAQPDPVALRDDDAEPIFLGLDAGAPLFAVARDDAPLTGLRDLAASLPSDRLGVLAYAVAMAGWTRSTRFCGACGALTTARDGGHVRACANGHTHHPRTDPVVIMLVADDAADRVLLGRQAAWPAGRYSALAGFVEPGEALEAAVAREVREEAGVEVAAVEYVASQPWPFPLQLMLGFQATYAGGEAAVGDAELEDVRWFSRDEVAAAARTEVAWSTVADPGDGAVLLPPRTAIARHLIERWLSAPAR